jgi:NADH-quinone oxidoreductase subunit J
VQDAPFLAAVQVIVYAGAIMILFLFVLMLIGVDSSDSLIETIKGQRIASFVIAVGFIALLTGAIGHAIAHTSAANLTEANADGNVQGIAELLFTTYVFPFEVTSALLIVAAVGAMVLGHREPTEPRLTQPELMRLRLHAPNPAAITGPGVFADHDAADSPALLPSGGPAPGSVYPEYDEGADQ